VFEHKTTTGPANIVITKEIEQFMYLYLVNLRKVIAKAGFESLEANEMRTMNKPMSHSYVTSKKFYQFPNPEKSVKVQKTIKHLNKRTFFTKEDQILLREWPMKNDQTPSLQLCLRISEKHQMVKSKKQLKDHWKTMKKI